MLTSLRQILDYAAEHGYWMPAFNFTNCETVKVVLRAAEDDKQPRPPTYGRRSSQAT